MKRVPDRSLREVAQEWDAAVGRRHRQIVEGQDLSFWYVLLEAIERLGTRCRWDSVLDVGCGSGVLTKRLAESSRKVVGLDVSGVSIDIAQRHCGNLQNLQFVHTPVENFARSHQDEFDVVIANMMLMTTPNLASTLEAIASVLRTGGHLVFTITHPCFWPYYWGYADEPWFHYSESMLIEGPLAISHDSGTPPVTTHAHRPVSLYIEELLGHGLCIESLMEPMPSDSVAPRYPDPWAFPRFLAGRCLLV